MATYLIWPQITKNRGCKLFTRSLNATVYKSSYDFFYNVNRVVQKTALTVRNPVTSKTYIICTNILSFLIFELQATCCHIPEYTYI